jgi:hypothetical protein
MQKLRTPQDEPWVQLQLSVGPFSPDGMIRRRWRKAAMDDKRAEQESSLISREQRRKKSQENCVIRQIPYGFVLQT